MTASADIQVLRTVHTAKCCNQVIVNKLTLQLTILLKKKKKKGREWEEEGGCFVREEAWARLGPPLRCCLSREVGPALRGEQLQGGKSIDAFRCC